MGSVSGLKSRQNSEAIIATTTADTRYTRLYGVNYRFVPIGVSLHLHTSCTNIKDSSCPSLQAFALTQKHTSRHAFHTPRIPPQSLATLASTGLPTNLPLSGHTSLSSIVFNCSTDTATYFALIYDSAMYCAALMQLLILR
jgi:hypothetical protein